METKQPLRKKLASQLRQVVFYRRDIDSFSKKLYKGKQHFIFGQGVRENTQDLSIHMKTMYEKITFVIAAAVYLFFHLRGGKTVGEMLAGTVMQLLTTAPYCIGFTWILTRVMSYLYHGKKLAWDRVARIFFAVGIFFGFFFALYENAERAEKERGKVEHSQRSLTENAATLNQK
jgi:hypothetical protein